MTVLKVNKIKYVYLTKSQESTINILECVLSLYISPFKTKHPGGNLVWQILKTSSINIML